MAIKHWDKGDAALSEADDICIEWNKLDASLWFDIDRDGTFRTLRKYPNGECVENQWSDAGAVFRYVAAQLGEIFEP
jgi:hypothetical protein